jgi:hypothetical protein
MNISWKTSFCSPCKTVGNRSRATLHSYFSVKEQSCSIPTEGWRRCLALGSLETVWVLVGFEPTAFWLWVQHPNHYFTNPFGPVLYM